MWANWQFLEAAGSILGAGGTVVTLLYGINQYRRQEVEKILSQLRDDCNQIQQVSDDLDNIIHDASFTAIGQALTRALDPLIPDVKSAPEYVDRLEKLSAVLLTTAMIPVTYSLPFLAAADAHRSRLMELAGGQVEYFPAIKRMMLGASQLVANVAGELLSSYIHRKVFEEDGFYDPKQFWSATREYAAHAENVEQARLAMARSFADLLSSYYESQTKRTFVAAKQIITAITKRVDKASTRELEELLRGSKKLERATDKIVGRTETWPEEIAALARSIKGFLGKDAYADIVQQCAILSEGPPTEERENSREMIALGD